MQRAHKGGSSSWTSSLQVVNEMLRRGRRDLVEALAGPEWYLDRKGEIPEGEQPYFRLPILNYHQVGHPGVAAALPEAAAVQATLCSLERTRVSDSRSL